MIVGIDLGTTNSAVAVLRGERPELIRNALGEGLTPSVVGFDHDGNLFVGKPARELMVTHPDRCAAVFKRQMGEQWSTEVAGKPFSAIQLSSMVLSALKADAENFLQQTVTEAVITVPAYFNDDQRHATIEAGKLAGLEVRRIINEPTAASLAYGIHEQDEEKTVAIIDLGGGTFDVSIVDFFEGAIEVRASAGEAILGGEDFTRAIANHILVERGLVYEHVEMKHPKMLSRLIQQCEKAKRSLTKSESCQIQVPKQDGTLDSENKPFEISREQLAGSCQKVLARIELPIRRAMGDAKLTRYDIDEVILVGGATRMPMIVSLVERLLEKEPLARFNPDEVVALGAAIQGALLSKNSAVDDLIVTDVAPFSLGVNIVKEMGRELRDGYFLPIINRNSVIPCSKSHSLGTIRANQSEVTLEVYQGEARRVQDNVLLGELEVKGIPRGPAGQSIDVRFTYDANGVLDVEVTIEKTGVKKNLVITRHAKNLSKKELKKALQEMQALKIHPREDSRNRFVLKRAERVYQELPTMLRDELSNAIDLFENALDRQEAEDIEIYRSHLEIFLSAHDSTDGDDQ